MLGTVRRVISALPRLHLLTEHARGVGALLCDVPAAAQYDNATPSVLAPFIRGYGTRGRPSSSAAPDTEDTQGDDGTVLTLPTSLDVIARLNPELRDVILAHAEHERLGDPAARAVQQLQSLVAGAPPVPAGRGSKAGGRVTKTSLTRLRVDELRGQLEALGSDPRGTKEVLVARLLGLLQEGEAARAQPPLHDFQDGFVTKRQVSQQRQQAAALAGAAPASSEASLRASWVEAAVQKSPFSSIMTHAEVAEILAEARGEDVCVIDVRASCPFTDWMVLATGRSRRLVSSLAGAVHHELKRRCAEVAPGVPPTVEGAQDEPDWLVVDAGDVVVHVFSPEARTEYDLEELWGDLGGSNVRRIAPRATAQTLDTATAD